MHVSDGGEWAQIVTTAYAAEARPPLTIELTRRVRDGLVSAIGQEPVDAADPGYVARLNEALDAFELELSAVVGPRVESLDPEAGVATMKYRSEAGQPLRSFGGQ